MDNRTKLTTAQKAEIIKLHDQGKTIYSLAKQFNVTRRTIQFTLYPERLKANRELTKKRGGWRIYYSKEIHARRMKKYRENKRKKQKNESAKSGK
jgi:Mor family transcriptional regulator